MNQVLIVIFKVLFWITEINLLYYAVLFLIGFIPRKQKYKLVDDKQKFCIFVPCHNEGAVVASTVRDYVNINYAKDLFDIFFIADNCIDNTAEILRQTIKEYNVKNFYVLERNVDNPKMKGKPHALRWAIEELEKENKFYSVYDMFMILDADNFVDADILKHINSQFLSYKENKRPVMIQTYLDSKNKETLISRGYYQSYRISNGFWQLSKQRMHLVPAIGGTGFAMTINFLKQMGGYNCTSLTEDLEIQTKAIIKNKNIVFNNNVRIYDEKPTAVKQSFVQRTRWAQGHWYNFFKYTFILFVSLFDLRHIKNFFKKLDMIVYLSVKLFMICSVFSSILGIYFLLFTTFNPMINYIVLSYVNLSCTILTALIIPLSSVYDGTKEEKKRILPELIPNMISVVLVSIIDICASFVALFKWPNQKTWKKTQHKVTQLSGEKFTKINSSSNNSNYIVETDKIENN